MKRILFLFLLTFSLSYSSSVAQNKDYSASSLTKEGDFAPDFTFQANDGKTYQLSDFRGKVVWLNFFATWCSPCIKELPELNHIAKEYPDVVFISIGRQHDIKTVTTFAKKKDLSFIIGADPKRKIYDQYAESYIPRNYLISSQGKIEMQTVGFDTEEFKEMAVKMHRLARGK